jgi:hypothetical protein
MKLISDSSPPMLLSLLKNDPCSDNAYFFELAKLQKRGEGTNWIRIKGEIIP